MENRAKPTAAISNLFIKPAHGAPMQPVDTLQAVAEKGLKGDQAYGRKSRQVLIVDREKLRTLSLEPGDLRENITVEGIEIDALPIGTTLQSDEVVFRIIDICDPCQKLEEIRPGLMKTSKGMRGMLAVIESGGSLTLGAPINILKTP